MHTQRKNRDPGYTASHLRLSYALLNDAAGLVVGARVPIILTSRADSPHTRLASCAVSSAN